MHRFKSLVNIAMVAIEVDGYGMLPGGHLLFASNMEDFGYSVEESIQAYNRAHLLIKCGETSSMVLY